MRVIEHKFMKKSKHKEINILYRIFVSCKEFSWLFLFSTVLILADIIFSIGSVVFFGKITDYIEAGEMEVAVSHLKIGAPIAIILIILVWFGQYMRKIFRSLAVEKLTTDALDKILHAPFKVISECEIGDIIYRLNFDSEKISDVLLENIFLILRDALICITAYIYLCSINLVAGFVILIFLLITFIFSRLFDFSIKKISKSISGIYGIVTGMVIDYLKGMSIIRVYNLQEVLIEKYNKELNKVKGLFIKRSLITSIASRLVPILNKVIISTAVLYVGILSIKGVVSIGSILSFIFLISKVQTPLFNISRSLTQIQQGIVSAERLLYISEFPTEYINNSKDNLYHESEDIAVELTNVGFMYQNCNKVLNNINLKIKNGEKVAIVGLSGSGKSTLIKLISGLFPADEGSIKIFGRDSIKDMGQIRLMIAYVSQSLGVFSASVKDNISCGACGNDNLEDVIEAAKKAGAHEFILRLEKGYDTELTESGSNLSGGQKQRITLARAFFRKAPIIILDEPESSLDKENMLSLYNTLSKIPKNHTLILISHNLQMLDWLDRIVVMEEGTIIQEGRPGPNLLLPTDLYFNKFKRIEEKCV